MKIHWTAAALLIVLAFPVAIHAQASNADRASYQERLAEEVARREKAWVEHKQLQEEETKRKNESWARWQEMQNTQETITAKQIELTARYEKLITKWEEQSKRFDKILEAMEKQFGLNKDEKGP